MHEPTESGGSRHRASEEVQAAVTHGAAALTIAIVALEGAHAAPLERSWRSRGHRVTVVTADPSSFPGAEVHGTVLGRLVRAASGSGAGTPALAAFTRRARSLLESERPDLVVALPGTALELIGLAPKTVLLADGGHVAHLAERLDTRPDSHGRVRLPVARCEAEYRGTTVVVPTAHTAASFASSGVTPFVVAPGLPEADGPAPSAPETSLRLATVQAPGWSQGTDRLDVLARLDRTEYVTVVDSGGAVDDSLSPALRFVGEQDASGIAEILGRSHAYVHLAREPEGAEFGLAALARGLPVLASESSALADLCAAGAGVVVADDASRGDCAAALERVLSEWEEMSSCARRLAAERPWSVAAEEILALAAGGVRVA